MIFVILGSQKFQFNRLLSTIDQLIDHGEIKEEVYAQIGYSDYQPVNYQFSNFLDREQFTEKIKESRIVITHAGTGSIMGAITAGKKTIAVPRLAKYGEHVNDHQLQILKQFEKMNLIATCYDMDKLSKYIKNIEHMSFKNYHTSKEVVIKDIDDYLKEIEREKCEKEKALYEIN